MLKTHMYVLRNAIIKFSLVIILFLTNPLLYVLDIHCSFDIDISDQFTLTLVENVVGRADVVAM